MGRKTRHQGDKYAALPFNNEWLLETPRRRTTRLGRNSRKIQTWTRGVLDLPSPDQNAHVPLSSDCRLIAMYRPLPHETHGHVGASSVCHHSAIQSMYGDCGYVTFLIGGGEHELSADRVTFNVHQPM
jgi:hypothetical protein